MEHAADEQEVVVYEEPVRWFWWPARDLVQRWRLFMLGGDEWCRRTLGVRLPGGMLFLPLWRLRGAVGPCRRCGQWETLDLWSRGYCGRCCNR